MAKPAPVTDFVFPHGGRRTTPAIGGRFIMVQTKMTLVSGGESRHRSLCGEIREERCTRACFMLFFFADDGRGIECLTLIHYSNELWSGEAATCVCLGFRGGGGMGGRRGKALNNIGLFQSQLVPMASFDLRRSKTTLLFYLRTRSYDTE